MKNVLLIGGFIAALLFGSFLWPRALSQGDSPVLSQNGLHWHPMLEIYVGDKKIEIPHNIGLSVVHKPVHTHDDLPIIHLEFGGIVREGDIMLGEFFKNWGKDMRSFGENVRMTVNGATSTDYERYIMKDKDIIKLHYD